MIEFVVGVLVGSILTSLLRNWRAQRRARSLADVYAHDRARRALARSWEPPRDAS